MKKRLIGLLCAVTIGSSAQSVVDVDGNVYNTVTIGTQEWMAENLKTTKYNDNVGIWSIPDSAWNYQNSNPGFCWLNNDSAWNSSKYGAIYNGYAVRTGKLCPIGWHIPTNTEWTTLIDYLATNGHSGKEGEALKSTSGYKKNGNGTDIYGFNAPPGGFRNGNGNFENAIWNGYWWSSSEYVTDLFWYRYMGYANDNVLAGKISVRAGLSVRCLSDNIATGMDNVQISTPLESVYPNPADNRISVSGVLSSGTISIVSLAGVEVISSTIETNSTAIDVSALTKGVYIISILNNTGAVIQSEKLIIAH